MYSRIRGLYLSGRMEDAQLDAAVEKGWITAEQQAELKAQKAQQ